MPLWMQLLINGGILQAPAEDDQGGGGAGGGKAPADDDDNNPDDDNPGDDNPDDDNPDDDKGGKGGGQQEPAKKPSNKPTDKEAELLKEVMKRKEREQKLQQELADLKGKVGDLDLDEVQKLIQDRKDQEIKDLEARGDFDRLKQRMADEHTAEVTKLQEKLNELLDKELKREKHINDLTVGSSFSQSKYVGDELTLTPTKARALYGNHFELEEGVVVGYDKPRGASERTQLVDARGNSLPFDEAMQKIIEADPEHDALVRSKVRKGSGSGSKPNKETPQPGKTLTAREKISQGLKSL